MVGWRAMTGTWRWRISGAWQGDWRIGGMERGEEIKRRNRGRKRKRRKKKEKIVHISEKEKKKRKGGEME